jgi:hypothetical protein
MAGKTRASACGWIAMMGRVIRMKHRGASALAIAMLIAGSYAPSIAVARSGGLMFETPGGFTPPPKGSQTNAESVVADIAELGKVAEPGKVLEQAHEAGLQVSDGRIRLIVESADPSGAAKGIQAAGIRVEASAGSLIQVLAAPGQVARLINMAGIERVRAPFPNMPDAVAGEGVGSTNASAWLSRGYDGSGVKIAVIDLGFAELAAAQASGDLPASLTTVDYCGGGFSTATDHGTAVAEVVHEMAPGASLYLVCVATEVDLANAEVYVKAQGIKIVNHSVSWFNTSRGDGAGGPGTPDAIVADAAASGIIWVNAAGNQADTHWSGAFVDDGDGFNLFAPGRIGNDFYGPSGEEACVLLKWDDWPVSAQDYDMFIARLSPAEIVASSSNYQTGSQPPVEMACYRNSGPGQYFFVMIMSAGATATPRFDLFSDWPLEFATAEGSVTEPGSSPAAMAVGAACWNAATIEEFSSQGPTIDGRTKPDITGPDQVSGTIKGAFTSCADGNGFLGTSAASPHVAGAAALAWQANPGYTVAQLKTYLETNAIDAGAVGQDSVYGYGMLHLPDQAATVPGKPTGVTATTGNAQATVSWSAPVSNGGSSITGYVVTSSSGAKTCSTTGALSCTVTGLTNGTSYTFTVKARNAIGTGPASDPSNSVTPTASLPAGASTYHPISPVRLLDTRFGNGHSGKLAANNPITFLVAGRRDIPAGATAVTGNVTAVNSNAPWAVYLGPDPVSYPSSSTINFATGQIVANGLTVALSAEGMLSATYMGPAGASTDLVFDVTGYYMPDSTGETYHPITPVRDLDTRIGNGLSGKIAANTPACFLIAGRNGVPVAARAITGNATVVNSSAPWAVYVGPDSTATPSTSSLNFLAGEIKANNVTVALTSAGKLCATYMGPSGASTDLVFDVTGYYTADTSGAAFVPVAPARLLDTRAGNGLSGRFTASTPRTWQITGRGSVPSAANAVTGNVTVVDETASWAVYVGPIATGAPTTSTLNFLKGDIKANGLTVALGSGGKLSATYMGPTGATTNLVFDVTGYFVPAST